MIPFDQRDGVIWYNGQYVSWKEAKVHVLNHGLHYASCVFEGIRLYHGKAFKLREHNARLKQSAQILGFEVPYSVEELDQAVQDTAAKQGVENGYARPLAWRGSEQMAILTDQSSVHTAIACWQWPSYFGQKALEKGLRLTVAKWKRPSPETAPTASKAAGLYMICTLSKNAAVAEGYDDALMLDWRGQLAEATGANLFLVIDGALHTPTPDCFLDGITRRTVIALAKARGIEVIERAMWPEDLTKAQEAFVTGTAAEVTPIGSIEGAMEGKSGSWNFTVGETTRTLMDAYTDLVHQPAAS